MHFIGKAVCLLPALSLQACAVATPVRLAVPRATPLPEEVALDVGKEANPLLTAFAARFASALGEGGIAVRDDAPFRLTLALSAQPSGSGVTSDNGKDARTVSWQSRARHRSLLENCSAQRLRAVVVGNTSLNANPPLVAEAELDTCKDRKAELDRLAVALASGITRR